METWRVAWQFRPQRQLTTRNGSFGDEIGQLSGFNEKLDDDHLIQQREAEGWPVFDYQHFFELFNFYLWIN